MASKTSKSRKKVVAQKRRVTLNVQFIRTDEIVLEVEPGVTAEELREYLQCNTTVYDKDDEFTVAGPGGGKLLAHIVEIPSTVEEEIQEVEATDGDDDLVSGDYSAPW